MLLLTYRNWFGPGRSWPRDKELPAKEEICAIVSNRDLPTTIMMVKSYSETFAEKSGMRTASEYTLLCVSEIADLTAEQIAAAGLLSVDMMVKAAEEGSD